MSRRWFGTDGIRGRVGEAPMTPDFVMRLGHAFGAELQHAACGARPAVLIGKDTRISGYLLESALEAGLAAAGVDSHLVGPLPTPGVAYLTRALRLSAGIVISASHNPYPDNGIKFFSASGEKLPDDFEARIEARLDGPLACRPAGELGRAYRVGDAAGRYIEFCKSTFPAHLDLRGLKLVVDCAHGAAYHIAPHVFHELGAEVVPLANQPDGLNINAACGATHPESLAAAVLAHGATAGIALDGDADRLIMADASGRMVDGDQLLYAIVRQRHAVAPVAGVAGTLMSNLGLEQALGRLGVPLGRAAVGDRHVLEMLRERGWLYGGESSGHIICLDRHTTGDGLVSALQVLAAMVAGGASLADLVGDMPRCPQVLRSVRLRPGFDWRAHVPLQAAMRAAESTLAGRGRLLVRPSGTEPLLRVMVEADDGDLAQAMVDRVVDAIPQSG
ncbi:MAG: phosphoglucosamine mutase [Rhodocyclaceae bacterium]|nr:phosphoglucosamine mutase [Rhodocyclaceae bacterium]